MKVFLSWSGEYSRKVAEALHEWLPMVINAVEPFISSEIEAGARWQSEVAEKLKVTSFGILCVTAENQHKPWLNFEAGALAKAVEASHVVPLAIDLRPAEIENPLAQFQAQKLTKLGMGKIVSAINSGLPNPLPGERIEKAMSMWWPELESQLKAIEQQMSLDPDAEESARSEKDMLEEILDTVRGIARTGERDIEVALDALDGGRDLQVGDSWIEHYHREQRRIRAAQRRVLSSVVATNTYKQMDPPNQRALIRKVMSDLDSDANLLDYRHVKPLELGRDTETPGDDEGPIK